MALTLGQRMKTYYEKRWDTYLPRRIPAIIRVDGSAFHTLLKNSVKPFDSKVMQAMDGTALYMMERIQGAYLAYVQSDEITIVLQDYASHETEAWHDYAVQKLASRSAAMASVAFNKFQVTDDAEFDGRCFSLPHEEVVNCILWRQQDWFRNSLSMYARGVFNHKELHNKNQAAVHDMLHKKGLNWTTDCSEREKNGTVYYRQGREIMEFNGRIADNRAFYEDLVVNLTGVVQ